MTSRKSHNTVCLLVEGYLSGCSSPVLRYGTVKPMFDSERPLGGFRALRIRFSKADAFIADARSFANTEPVNQTSFYRNLLAKIERDEPVAVASIIRILGKLLKIARDENATSRNDLLTLWQVIDHFQYAQNFAVFAAQSALAEIYTDYEV